MLDINRINIKKKKQSTPDVSRLLDLLNQVMQIEYTMIIDYPQIASAIKNEEIRDLALKLGNDSLEHSDIVANAILKLGGEVKRLFEPLPIKFDLVEIFKSQREKEELAAQLYRQGSEIAPEISFRDKFLELTMQENEHVHIVDKILAFLDVKPE